MIEDDVEIMNRASLAGEKFSWRRSTRKCGATANLPPSWFPAIIKTWKYFFSPKIWRKIISSTTELVDQDQGKELLMKLATSIDFFIHNRYNEIKIDLEECSLHNNLLILSLLSLFCSNLTGNSFRILK